MESTKSRQKFTETVEVFRLAALHLVFLQEPMVEMAVEVEVVGCRFPERALKTLRLDVQQRARPVLLRIPTVRVRELKSTRMKLRLILRRVR